LIILIIVYIWGNCLLVSLFIYNKVIIQIISPINNLQQALLSNSIKDNKIFEYEYDEFINDFFLTCKELLTKQIDKSSKEKVIDNLNHHLISKEKSKDSEENKYAKNLRLNNDILKNLMNQQKSLMDFSKYIETNENNYLENYLVKRLVLIILVIKIIILKLNLTILYKIKILLNLKRRKKKKKIENLLKNYFKYLNIFTIFWIIIKEI